MYSSKSINGWNSEEGGGSRPSAASAYCSLVRYMSVEAFLEQFALDEGWLMNKEQTTTSSSPSSSWTDLMLTERMEMLKEQKQLTNDMTLTWIKSEKEEMIRRLKQWTQQTIERPHASNGLEIAHVSAFWTAISTDTEREALQQTLVSSLIDPQSSTLYELGLHIAKDRHQLLTTQLLFKLHHKIEEERATTGINRNNTVSLSAPKPKKRRREDLVDSGGEKGLVESVHRAPFHVDDLWSDTPPPTSDSSSSNRLIGGKVAKTTGNKIKFHLDKHSLLPDDQSSSPFARDQEGYENDSHLIKGHYHLRRHASGDYLNDMDSDSDGDSFSESASKKRKQSMLKKNTSSGLKQPAVTKGLERRDENDILEDRSDLWYQIVKKQIPRVAKTASTCLSTSLLNCKRIADLCCREIRRCFFKQERNAKELAFRHRRLMREMLAYWKKNEKEEKELRRKAEKQAQEQRKAEEEAREARRQARKLDFLINQTELYSHFIAKKSDGTTKEATSERNSYKNDTISTRDLFMADDSEAALKERARLVAVAAVQRQTQHMKDFDADVLKQRGGISSSLSGSFQSPAGMPSETIQQPLLLQCTLKSYQLRGLSWLANLYEQGINGILADEMGLGKTVQSISLLAHLSERHGIWGPFLVIAPASTLHNWQQELARFVPTFRILPYWGSLNDRKVLRRFWNPGKLHTQDSPFHVLITSYQLIVSDEKYFQRIHWQYMILDEAQAIKSSGSVRWKTLLGFKCRNRLLLTGTPIQNSMQELWALLHFIMPTLFDSHDEFSEWFSKDIESHAEHKSGLDAHQLSRLHMILKPFMLRRIKKDVENELGDKIELEIPCALSAKQKRYYGFVRQKLMNSTTTTTTTTTTSTPAPAREGRGGFFNARGENLSSSLDHLMNLVMQFRKICNHPELLEKSDVTSPFYFGVVHSGHSAVSRNLDWTGTASSILQIRIPKLLLDLTESLVGKLGFVQDRFSLLYRITERMLTVGGLFAFLGLLTCSIQEFMCHVKVPVSLCFKPLRNRLTQNNVLHCTPLECDSTIRYLMVRMEPFYLPAVLASPPELFMSRPSYTRTHLDTFYVPSHGLSELEVLLRPIRTSYYASSSPPPLLFYDPVSSYATSVVGKTPLRLPHAQDLIAESGKIQALDRLLPILKQEGHRVLLYFQMTRMIDLMEDYLRYRGYSYLRLDGSSKISDRRDLVTDWQTKSDLFIFLLSTRAGGLGINLTAADTVIFYDSDWNPTVDQQAMDRAHRLGQTKQVTVYRLITKGTIEDRVQQRALQKHEIQKVVIAGTSQVVSNTTTTTTTGGGESKQEESEEPSTFAGPSDLNSKDIYSILMDERNEDDEGGSHLFVGLSAKTNALPAQSISTVPKAGISAEVKRALIQSLTMQHPLVTKSPFKDS